MKDFKTQEGLSHIQDKDLEDKMNDIKANTNKRQIIENHNIISSTEEEQDV